DVPAIGETGGGRLVVAWPEYHGDDPGAGYAPRIAAQLDDGSFSPAWSPDDVRRGMESGFVGFVATAEGLRMFWLDGRELGRPGHDHGQHGSMRLRSVLIDDEGRQAGPSSVHDERTCECCKLGVGCSGGRRSRRIAIAARRRFATSTSPGLTSRRCASRTMGGRSPVVR
ncbi:MAG: hypothetical protein HC927_11080, partial [Deltaproteobacteria bacterium]|nr:hypothetical protein [Deltaproteobacteria bacterium]